MPRWFALAHSGALAAIATVACDGDRAGGGPSQGVWTLQATGAVTAVTLTADTPEARFDLQVTLHHDGDLATLDGAVALTLAQPVALARHAVDWPLRNEFCQLAGDGFCQRFVKWQAYTPADGACDGAGTCVLTMSVAVTAIDPESLPAAVEGLELWASGYLRGPTQDPDGTTTEVPPDTTLTLTLVPATVTAQAP